tara:strand:+ start:59 stop:394 length:336 start_codon:yes stop_codon:yes gene_type:complete
MSNHNELRKCLKGLTDTHKETIGLLQEAVDAERQAYKALTRHKLKIAKMLKHYRQSYDLTLDQLAERSSFSRTYIHYVESGRRWSPEVIADVLRIFSAIDREEAEDVRSLA